MTGKVSRITSVVLAVLIAAAVSGCAGKKLAGKSSSSRVVDSDAVSGQNSVLSGASAAASGASAVSAGVSSSAGSGAAKLSSAGNGKVNPAKYRGTTVKYATWKDPQANEDGVVVSKFEKKYGIKVQVVMVPQGTYIQNLTGMVNAGTQPDICFDNGVFPSSLSVLQPLAASGTDLSDPIWDKNMIAASTINGKPYLVDTVADIWSEVDCVYYNKRLMGDNNIRTPEDYYNAGVWTYDALHKVLQDVAALGDEYAGGYLDPQILAASQGACFYQYSKGKFTSGASNPMLTNVYKFIAQCNKEGLLVNARDGFLNGKLGLCTTNAFGLKKTGYWAAMNPSDIGFTYLPDYDKNHKAKPCGIFRGWGIVKGAKNPVGSGIFLRYYLDTNNYNTSSAFISTAAETFFFKLTGINTAQKNYYLTQGVVAVAGGDLQKDYQNLVLNDPAQISQKISAMSNVLNTNASKANAFVAKQIAQYK